MGIPKRERVLFIGGLRSGEGFVLRLTPTNQGTLHIYARCSFRSKEKDLETNECKQIFEV